ncbi:MAG TPA: tRNA pseudouridine(55) synthase TruB, partial [Trichocoleus sp.]
PQFLGTLEQIPPSYSAVQVGGRRLYDLARQGTAVEAPKRQVEIKQIEVLGWQLGEFPELTVAITCGPGTYIRSIARDLGAALGVGGTLAKLLRTHSSGFDLANSLSLEALQAQAEAQTPALLPPDQALAHLPILDLPAEPARRWRQGQKIPTTVPEPGPNSIYRIFSSGQFLGIAEIRAGEGTLLIAPQMVYEPLG